MSHVRAMFWTALMALSLSGVACSSTPTATPSSSTGAPTISPSPSASPIADAVAFRTRLLDLAKQPGAIDYEVEPNVTTWQTAFPGIDFAGSAVPADPTTVSGALFVDSKTKDVSYLAFAVMDTTGKCRGGVIEANDDKTVRKVIEVFGTPAKCTGGAVSDEEGY